MVAEKDLFFFNPEALSVMYFFIMHFSLVLEESDPACLTCTGSEAVHSVFLPYLCMVKSPSEMPSFLLRYDFVVSDNPPSCDQFQNSVPCINRGSPHLITLIRTYKSAACTRQLL